MAEEEAKKMEAEPCSEAPTPPPLASEETIEAAPEEKSVIPPPLPPPEEKPATAPEEKSGIPPPLPPPEEKRAADDFKALATVEKPEPVEEKKPEGSIDRDAVLARVATQKRLSLIKAWEESEKSKAENKSQKKISDIAAWEINKKASLEAELKKIEEQLEKKKAEYVEKIKNKVEKRAMIEAKRGEDLLKAEEMAAKYCATRTSPKILLGCF